MDVESLCLFSCLSIVFLFLDSVFQRVRLFYFSQSMMGKVEVFCSPELQLSKGRKNRSRIVTSGKFWERGFRSEQSKKAAFLCLLLLMVYLCTKLSAPFSTSTYQIFIKVSFVSLRKTICHVQKINK